VGIDVPEVKLRYFGCRAWLDGNRIHLSLIGTADLGARDELAKVLDRLHGEALRTKVNEVVVDFRQLEFMNSGCFQTVVTWIGQAQLLDPEGQYRIRILSNPDMHWQKRSLHALRCFADQIITVET
jgi:hypothetical protein